MGGRRGCVHVDVAYAWGDATQRTGEERLPAEHLAEDAAHRPDVDGGGVLGAGKHDFGRAVPPRHHVPVSGVGV